jgi:predicted AAA+ superfamily ATPase
LSEHLVSVVLKTGLELPIPDCGITQPTAKAWLSVLETSLLAFRLQPFQSNLRKRLVKMPKLHFYDSGLVCWLLGIREASQLRSHPLRGAIFESWVVSEILKRRTNRGESRRLSFYRDRDGVEVDVVVEHSDRLELVEAKSAETASSSFFAGGLRVKGHLDSGPQPCEVVAVYGGDRGQRRSEARLVPWSGVGDRTWER